MIKCPHCGQEIEEWASVSATMPIDSRQVLDDAIEELRREGFDLHRNKRVAMGQVLEMLSASYLAERRQHAQGKREADARIQLPAATAEERMDHDGPAS